MVLASAQKGVRGQFDGTNRRPATIKEGEMETDEHRAALAAWKEKENLALYLFIAEASRSSFCQVYAERDRRRNVVGP